MRIDLEQFLALTVALGTAGAIGAAVYTQARDQAPAAASVTEPTPGVVEAPPEVAATAVPIPIPTPAQPAEPTEVGETAAEADAIGAPDVEGANW